jgi:ribonuclease HI
MNKYIAYCDGSHNPENNSGGYGFVVYEVNKEKRLIEWGKLNRTINNSSDCEKYALLELLKWIEKNIPKSKPIIIRGDDESLINQMKKYWNGLINITEPELWKKYAEKYPNMVFEWVPRDENIAADGLSRLELSLQKQLHIINEDNYNSNQNPINQENEVVYNVPLQIPNSTENIIQSLVDEKLWKECKEHYIQKSESALKHGGLMVNEKLIPKKRVKKMCDKILNSKNNGDWLNDNELNFLMDVLPYHPKYVYFKQKKIKKIGVFSTIFDDKKSFIVVFETGELKNVSINKCIHTPKKSFNDIMKNWKGTISKNSSIVINLSPPKIGKMFLKYLKMNAYDFLTHPCAKNVWGAPGDVNPLFNEFYKFYIELFRIT